MITRLGISASLNLTKNIKTSGTITPSSRALINKMLLGVDFAEARCLVELGAGDGCFTRELLNRMRGDAILISLELDKKFAARIAEINDNRLHVHNACASTLCAVLASHDIVYADYVISSLPLAILNNALVDSILAATQDCLSPQGKFLQYQYSLTQYSKLKTLFSQVERRFALRNVPPAFVYECSGAVSSTDRLPN